MKNPVICKNCSAENPVYSHTCGNCRYFIRDRVYNINIWETIGQIIESPGTAYKKVIYSEHKNFIVFLTFLLALRYLILSRFVSVPLSEATISSTPLLTGYLITLAATTGFLLAFAFIAKVVFNSSNYKVRIRDIYALNVYSNIPNFFAVLFLLPIELVIFGDYIFSNNPTPFQMKPLFAYVLAAVEVGLIIWSILLNIKSFTVLTNNKLTGMITGLINLFLISGLIYILAETIFFL